MRCTDRFSLVEFRPLRSTDRQASNNFYVHQVVCEIAERTSSPINDRLFNGGVKCAANTTARRFSTLAWSRDSEHDSNLSTTDGNLLVELHVFTWGGGAIDGSSSSCCALFSLGVMAFLSSHFNDDQLQLFSSHS